MRSIENVGKDDKHMQPKTPNGQEDFDEYMFYLGGKSVMQGLDVNKIIEFL